LICTSWSKAHVLLEASGCGGCHPKNPDLCGGENGLHMCKWTLLVMYVNVLNLKIIDLPIKYHTHLQREIEKEEAREKE
jgi:hypothetical protein